jgi:hypothetical protein
VTSAREGIPPLGEGLEHLRRPDDGNVRRLAQPEHLLLHFREALEADLYAQAVLGHAATDPADLSVVEQEGLADPHAGEDLGQGAGNERRPRRVADRAPFQDLRPERDGPGAQLRAGKIAGQQAAPAGIALRLAQVPDHALPDLRAVVRTIDPHDLHAGLDQAADDAGVVGRLARHRHHDPRAPPRARGTEDPVGVLGQECVTGVELDRRGCRHVRRHRPREKFVEDLLDRMQGRHDMRFHAAQRTEAQSRQVILQHAHVVAAHREVVNEVAGTIAHRRRDGIELGGELLLGRERGTAQLLDAAAGALRSQGAGYLPVSAPGRVHGSPWRVSRTQSRRPS